MSKEYTAKTFKSGNSVALRLPKALGVTEGLQMTVRKERDSLIIEQVDRPKRKFDVEKVWGIGKGLNLKPLAPEDRIFEDRQLASDDLARP